jgi:enoyl reductase-like protein
MVNMMGYANPAQIATGIHGRLYARALYAKTCEGNPIVYVTIDNGMASVAVKRRIIEKLNKNGVNILPAQLIYRRVFHLIT